jgi:hypothetical protein
MNRFELHVDQSGLDENRQLVFFIVKEMFKAVETSATKSYTTRRKSEALERNFDLNREKERRHLDASGILHANGSVGSPG